MGNLGEHRSLKIGGFDFAFLVEMNYIEYMICGMPLSHVRARRHVEGFN